MADTHGPMDEDTYAGRVRNAILASVQYIDSDVAPGRARATAYYRGDPFGNEETGRSQIVMTEVRDVVQAVMPELLRIFLGSENVVEYLPRTEAKIEEAEQATDYVNYIIHVDNPGFQIFFSAFKDALIRKTGVLKWYVEEKKRVVEEQMTEITEDMLKILEMDDDLEILETIPDEPEPLEDALDPAKPAGPPQTTYTVRTRRELEEKIIRVEALPPEEYFIDRNARDLDHAVCQGHRRELTVSDLVAMGYDLEEVLEHAGSASGFETNNERLLRNPAASPLRQETGNDDPMMRPVLYCEAYLLADKDGDGIAELRRVCTIGMAHYILHDEVWTEMAPFAALCPDPEPHTVVGYSLTDQVKDLQEIKSALVRNTLDSLAQVIHPRTAVVENAVNMDDVLNTEVGGVIRMKQAGAVQPLAEPFVGQAALPIISYFDDLRARRTGVSDASQGLDPDVLQSTTKAAVTATMTGAQSRIEMIARIFAETGIKRLFKGLLRLAIQNQDQERIVKLRGKWTPVDPRGWDAEMDVIVNVGLGSGSPTDKVQLLMQVAAKQEQIIQTLGPQNPLCGIGELRNTYADILSLSGRRDVTRYFKPFDPNTPLQPPQQGGGGNDPTAALADAEKAKTAAMVQMKAMELEARAAADKMQDDRERDKMMIQARVDVLKVQAQYGQAVDLAQLDMWAKAGEQMRDQAHQQNLAAMQPPAPPPGEGPAPGGPPNG